MAGPCDVSYRSIKGDSVNYISTRGEAPALDFTGVLLTGLAADGGLYVPAEWPRLKAEDLRKFAAMSYADMAIEVMAPFVAGIARADFAGMVREACASFEHGSVAPLRQIGPNQWLMELFHGPTLAFKDVAMQLLGRLFDHVLTQRGESVTIVGATSGDTGSAAIEACRDRAAIRIFILHPKDRVSEVQRRQMTTVRAANVRNIALTGTFDDCQAQLKAMFNDAAFRRRARLSAVNSINWARIVAQVVYYVHAAAQLGATPDRPITFAVPTGNFGDAFAGYVAARMGVPIGKLLVATNRNDILHRFLQTGEYRMEAVSPTQSPSMDIQIASNFERLLFDLYDRDGTAIAGLMRELAESDRFCVDAGRLARARNLFDSARADEETTMRTIGAVWRETGILIDPHTAVGVHAARALPETEGPMVTLATAHPAKFPDAVEAATGVRPKLPPRLRGLFAREERYAVLPNDLGALEAYVLNELSRNSEGDFQL